MEEISPFILSFFTAELTIQTINLRSENESEKPSPTNPISSGPSPRNLADSSAHWYMRTFEGTTTLTFAPGLSRTNREAAISAITVFPVPVTALAIPL